MNIEEEGGLLDRNGMQIKFPRNADGKYTHISTQVAPKSFIVTHKYNQQAYFCIGMVKVRLLNGEIEGIIIIFTT